MDQHRGARYGLFERSQTEYQLRVAPTWHYFSFFRLLQVSPSYLLAHDEVNGGVGDVPLPDSFSAVRETYRRFGDVWQVPFWQWWLDRAQYEFGVKHDPSVVSLGATKKHEMADDAVIQGMRVATSNYYGHGIKTEGLPSTVLLAVPTSGNKKRIMEQVSAILDKHLQDGKHIEPEAAFPIIKNKTRRKTLDAAIRCVRARAFFPNKKLYEIAELAELSKEMTDELNRLRHNQPLKRHSDPTRDASSVVSRHIRRCHRWAENAARGRFPDMDEPADEKDWPPVDFDRLRSMLENYVRVSEEAFDRIPASERTSEKRYAGPNRTIQK